MSCVDIQSQTTPLWGIWEFWCDLPESDTLAPTWLDSIKSFGVFDTVEGFWGIHGCILTPSRAPFQTNYYLFRHNIAPLWEHEGNRRGGKWICHIDSPDRVDAAWQEICLNLIGERLECAETEICGCVVSKKKNGYKLSLWTRTASDEETQILIGKFFLAILARNAAPNDQKPTISYMSHGSTVVQSTKDDRKSAILYTLA